MAQAGLAAEGDGPVHEAAYRPPGAHHEAVGLLALAAEVAVVAGVVDAVVADEGVPARGHEQAQGHDDDQLPGRRGAQQPAEHPQQHDGDVGQDDAEGRADVREPQLDEEVVEVGLVGFEGREALDHPPDHHAQGVEDRDAQHGEGVGQQAEAALLQCGAGRVGVEDVEHGDGHRRAEHQRAGVADEHLGALAEHVVQEEGHERAGEDQQAAAGHAGAHAEERAGEDQAGHDPEAGAVAVHAVDQVDGVDDAHAGEDAQRGRPADGDRVEAEGAVEVVDAEVARAHQDPDNQDLHQEAEGGGQAAEVVPQADQQHHGQGERGHHHPVGAVGGGQDEQAGQQAGVHDHAAQHRHGLALELAGVGVVEDAPVQREAARRGVDEQGDCCGEEGDQETLEEDWHLLVCVSVGGIGRWSR